MIVWVKRIPGVEELAPGWGLLVDKRHVLMMDMGKFKHVPYWAIDPETDYSVRPDDEIPDEVWAWLAKLKLQGVVP